MNVKKRIRFCLEYLVDFRLSDNLIVILIQTYTKKNTNLYYLQITDHFSHCFFLICYMDTSIDVRTTTQIKTPKIVLNYSQ